ncbi:hypothetical protein SAMN05444521_6042 [Streptomyces sp. 3214.6]|nr:hypothetical protein SAMN05444521_6042 [Streptomyces sp. 3214.6]
MTAGAKHRFLTSQADARYRALIHHCFNCEQCRADRTKECPESAELRRTWRQAWRRAQGGKAT